MKKYWKKLRRLALDGHDMILRIPLIPGINDDMQNISRTADFIEQNIRRTAEDPAAAEFYENGRREVHVAGQGI